MAGLNTYYGNAMSDHAELHLDLTALGGMVGLSRNPAINSAAALRFREDFGPRKVFVLPGVEDQRSHNKHRTGEQYAGRVLLDAQWNYRKLYSLMFQHDAQIKKTQLSEAYQFAQWRNDNSSDDAVPIFAVDQNDQLYWFTQDEALEAKPGWTIYALSRSAGAGAADAAAVN